MSEKNVVVWITKYAFTSGVERVMATIHDDGLVSYGRPWYEEMFYAQGNDWHRTPEAAISRAEQMRTAKIAALKRNIARLENLVFKATGDGK